MMLTDKEKNAMLKSIHLWESLLELKSEHPDFINEARFHIHALQSMIAAGPGLREINNGISFDKTE